MVARFRSRVEDALRQQLPFDNEVLAYLLKVAPASQAQELLEYVADFCPRWSSHDQAALVSLLHDYVDDPAGQAQTQSSWAGGQSSADAGAAARGQAQDHHAATEKELAADMMLAQMLQDEEEAAFDVARGGGRPGAKKQSKKTFKPLPVNYTIGRNAGPAQLGTEGRSLAETLRSRRAQQPGTRPGVVSAWEPQPADGLAPGPRQPPPWAPTAQDGQALTWAERAQVAQEQAAAAEAAAAVAAAAAANADFGQAKGPGGRPMGSGALAPGNMQLTLLVTTGGEYQVSANLSDTIGTLKARVEKLHQVPVGRQRIFVAGRELTDATEVRSLGLRSGQPLQLALRNALGGAATPAASRQAPPPPASPPRRALAPATDEFSVKLKLPGGVTSPIEGLQEDATVSELKRRIQQEFGIRHDHVLLSFFGCPLPDASKLADCGVASGAQLDVTLRPPGAAAAEEAAAAAAIGPDKSGDAAAAAKKGKNNKKKGKGKDSEVGDGQDGHASAGSSLPRAQAKAATQLPPRAAAANTRAGLVRAVFAACDMDRDGRLNEQELRAFAQGTGFDGGPDDWAEEYRSLCAEHGKDDGEGLDEEALARLVDDESDSGCYCTDDELRAMVATLRSAGVPERAAPTAPQVQAHSSLAAVAVPTAPVSERHPQPSQPPPAPVVPTAVQESRERDELIVGLFHKCDADRDGFLGQQEMRTFADLTGFDGNGDDWAEEFSLLCGENQIDPHVGIPLELFLQFVNDESDTGQYCTDNELRDMDGKLPAPPIVRAPPGLDAFLPPVQPAPPPQQRPAQQARPPLEARSRVMMVEDTFLLCDKDRDGRLSSAEMRAFATFVGFQGEEGEWAEEFAALLGESGTNPDDGVSLNFFKQLVDDVSDSGCFCTDAELRQLLTELEAVVALQ